MSNVKSFISNLKKRVNDQAERKIVAARADIARTVSRILIAESPVLSGTYVKAHTVAINGIPIRTPQIYFSPEYDPKSAGLNVLAYKVAMRLSAAAEFESNEIEVVAETKLSDKVSIIMQVDPVYWAETYVEPTYHIYERTFNSVRNVLNNSFTPPGKIETSINSIIYNRSSGEYDITESSVVMNYGGSMDEDVFRYNKGSDEWFNDFKSRLEQAIIEARSIVKW